MGGEIKRKKISIQKTKNTLVDINIQLEMEKISAYTVDWP